MAVYFHAQHSLFDTTWFYIIDWDTALFNIVFFKKFHFLACVFSLYRCKYTAADATLNNSIGF